MDLFEEYLQKDCYWMKRALTDKSYKKYCEKNKIDYNIDKDNMDLATLGDAVIKYHYSDILLDKVKKLTESKKNYESDKVLVTKIAKHYNLLNFIKFDINDKNKPQNYNYTEYSDTNRNKLKYIATAVEAIIGAMHKCGEDDKNIRNLLLSWMEF